MSKLKTYTTKPSKIDVNFSPRSYDPVFLFEGINSHRITTACITTKENPAPAKIRPIIIIKGV